MKSFSEIDIYNFEESIIKSKISKIKACTKEYLLGVDEESYKQYLCEESELEQSRNPSFRNK